MGRTITVKMAKPSQKDFDTVHAFLQGIETIMEGYDPDDETGEAEPLDDGGQLAWIEKKWKAVSCSWSRVLWAGKTAIDNCCDPDADVLEFNPQIKAALKAAGYETE